MSEILLCNQPLNSQNLQNQCGISMDQVASLSCVKPNMIAANTPYLVGDSDRSILSKLSPNVVAKQLTPLSLSFGGDNVVALAEITAQLKDFNIGLMGASTSMYANRIGGFVGSIRIIKQL